VDLICERPDKKRRRKKENSTWLAKMVANRVSVLYRMAKIPSMTRGAAIAFLRFRHVCVTSLCLVDEYTANVIRPLSSHDGKPVNDPDGCHTPPEEERQEIE
jgi:hypothetical protein